MTASARVQLEWARRVEAEYHSAAITSELSLWLIRIAASPDLIEDALVIVSDELTHARLSHEVWVAAGGPQTMSRAPMTAIDRKTLGLRRHLDQALELDVVRTAVATFCLGETIAVPLFSHLRRDCTEAAPRAALDRILVDEVRHRDFGWDLLGWMLDQPQGDAYRDLVRAELPRALSDLEHAYGRTNPAIASDEPVTDAERAWGLAPAGDYAELLDRTLLRDYQPRFAELGIDAQAAWDRRPR